MPARSKSQQRLFGMVHAYNKGEFHGSRSLRNRLAALSKQMSKDDVYHFAKTKHDDLPETKAAQALMRPEDVQELYSKIPVGVYASSLTPRSERRRTVLGRILSGSAAGAALGGLGFGALGYFLANKAMQGTPNADPEEAARRLKEAGIRCGLWGAGKGALAGATAGLGLSILDKIRGDS